MPLGPWAIAKRSLRIQVVFLTSHTHHLLDGVMDKALTFCAEGPGFKSQLEFEPRTFHLEGECLFHYSTEEVMLR